MILNLGLTKGFRRSRQMRVDADPRPFLRCKAAPKWRLCDRVAWRNRSTPKNAAALAALYGFPVPDWMGLRRLKWSKPARAADSICSTAWAEIFCDAAGAGLPSVAPWPRAGCASTRHHPDRQMLIESKREVILLPPRRATSRTTAGPRPARSARHVQSRNPASHWRSARRVKILRELAATVALTARICSLRNRLEKCARKFARVIPFYEGIQNLQQTACLSIRRPALCAGWKFATSDGKPIFAPCHYRSRRPGALLR